MSSQADNKKIVFDPLYFFFSDFHSTKNII